MARYLKETYDKAAEMSLAGVENSEIAKVLGIKPNGVARVIKTGIKKLQEGLSQTEQVALVREESYSLVVLTPSMDTLMIVVSSIDIEEAINKTKKGLAEGVKIVSVELLEDSDLDLD